MPLQQNYIEKTLQFISSHGYKSSGIELLQEVSTFSKEKQQHDDLTLVLFKWKN